MKRTSGASQGGMPEWNFTELPKWNLRDASLERFPRETLKELSKLSGAW